MTIRYSLLLWKHRVKCDKSKGILSKSMPKEWYSPVSNKIKEDDSEQVIAEKNFNMSILADKKPYFFIYNYPNLKKDLKNVKNGYNEQSIIEFGVEIDELVRMDDLTERQQEVVDRYKRDYPVHENPCAMNRICWKLEDQVDDILKRRNRINSFNYDIMKSGYNYKEETKDSLKKLYRSYKRDIEIYNKFERDKINRTDGVDVARRERILTMFKEEAETICTNKKELCDILVDLVVEKKVSEHFLWEISENTIIENLLSKNNNTFKYLVKDEDGDVDYAGMKFKLKEKVI